MLCRGDKLLTYHCENFRKNNHRCPWWACSAHLVAVHHKVVCGDERFKHHYPAVTGCALQQCVCQVGNADVQLIGAVDQVWRTQENNNVDMSVKY